MIKLKRNAGLIAGKSRFALAIDKLGWKGEAIGRELAKKIQPIINPIPVYHQPKPYIAPVQTQSGNPLGNFIFIVLHVMAVLFGFFLLFFTIPAHLIYLALVNKK
ncbi:MAG: hypothetical protein WAW36_18975 [Methylovulum miyakonense]|uniref:hypothetical protein n=1 Tax=Methylovulum miyakonense TaxID=645578 RepID=UPI003BB61BD7